ncbi:MAG: ribosome maturation factor RimP [Eubacteriaceae bacterium]|nr:ribosome maturation factor RimP [Eubacteriaceae bacterium]
MGFLDEMIELAEPIIREKGCEMADAEFVKEGSIKILRFYIEKAEGAVTLDDCAAVSEEISRAIDERGDDGQEEYTLEVSSPGINRVLKKEKDYERFSGSKVDVSLYKAINGDKKPVLILNGHSGGVFSFTDMDGNAVELKDSEVSRINLHFDFDF